MTTIAVFGAYGHTGRFVTAELADRGLVPLALGRDESRLRALGLDHRVAGVGDLDRALVGTAAVINCAGPFADTAAPLVEAALRAGIPYVDVAAEIEANVDTFAHFADRARTAVVPAMAFFGGLGDLLVTAAMSDWTAADEAHVAYGLSSWHPTAGTLASGTVSHDRRGGRRVRYTRGRLDYYTAAALPALTWDFPDGSRAVLGDFSMADIVTVPSHLPIPEVRTYMSTNAAGDLAAADPAGPSPTQTFTVDVRVRRAGTERRISATGQDIYAVSAPLAVEAVERILDGRTKAIGVASAGRMFDAADFLRALEKRGHISLDAH
ncbi:saccharopine dehydrogenase NADP-binding domain-containing protein [Asanoa siamensis]|uniref:Saccharopine dehydrogenase n=1 Tax=Asanoa siamensis TaxID=926357 RepID=A0ABQ4D0X4_9ACTN|nr:saccharopine dehydrogenase NADP-binding domain-containing protein [Asanoa siamensis]GIF77195.1 saccharopine dehydrogenase [Asanoa siamensis]